MLESMPLFFCVFTHRFCVLALICPCGVQFYIVLHLFLFFIFIFFLFHNISVRGIIIFSGNEFFFLPLFNNDVTIHDHNFFLYLSVFALCTITIRISYCEFSAGWKKLHKMNTKLCKCIRSYDVKLD